MRRVLAQVVRLRDPGLLVCALVCFTTAAAMVAVPLGVTVAGVSFVVMDLATSDDTPSR